MIEGVEQVTGKVADDLSPGDLLALARSRKAAEDQAAADLLEVAARWADLHPPESIHSAASFTTIPGCEHEEPIAGEGAPLVAEFCLAELGTVLGTSTNAAKRLVGHALELRHRLPRLWAAVQSGSVPAWRARSVAEVTIHAVPALTPAAAAFVDGQVAAVAGRVGPAQLDRLVAEAIKRHDLAHPDPAADPEDGYLHVDPRHVTINTQDVHFAGTLHVEADLDLADGLDLAHAVSQGAEQLKALGSSDSLDARRAKALGDLARTQTALDLAAAAGGGFEARSARTSTTEGTARTSTTEGTARTSTAEGTARASTSEGDGNAEDTGVRLPAARELVLHAHFDATAAGDSVVFGPTGRLEEGQRLVLLDQLQSWCGDSRTRITIKPVIDLNARLQTPAYEVPDTIREHVLLRDRTCVFPWCTRPARRCDADHINEYDHDAEAEGRPQSGPTATWNLGALCRYHHRLKTHSAWTYRMVAPGVFEWTSPHGHRYRRGQSGTTRIDKPDPDPDPDREPDDPVPPERP